MLGGWRRDVALVACGCAGQGGLHDIDYQTGDHHGMAITLQRMCWIAPLCSEPRCLTGAHIDGSFIGLSMQALGRSLLWLRACRRTWRYSLVGDDG
jgi:hypothetical protein